MPDPSAGRQRRLGAGAERNVLTASPWTPSGSASVNRHSYSVPGWRSKMLPANIFGQV